jgi:hypothetical protein
MLFPSMACGGKRNGLDLNQLSKVGNESKNLSEEIIQLSSVTQNRVFDIFRCSDEIKNALVDNIDGTRLNDTLEELLGDKVNEIKSIALGVDDLATQCYTKAASLKDTLSLGAESISDTFKGENAGNETDADGNEQEIEELEKSISNVDALTESIRGMNVFTAAPLCKTVFGEVIEKKSLIESTFHRVQELCTFIAKATQTIVTTSCCNEFRAGLDSAKAILSSLRLSNFIEKLLNGMKRLFHTISSLISTLWENFQRVSSDWQSGKGVTEVLSCSEESNSLAESIIQNGTHFVARIAGGSSVFPKIFCG